MKSSTDLPSTGDGKMKFPKHIQESRDICPLNHQETKPGEIKKKNRIVLLKCKN
jgi:hypothetical protein